jgi:hypothetical protein
MATTLLALSVSLTAFLQTSLIRSQCQLHQRGNLFCRRPRGNEGVELLCVEGYGFAIAHFGTTP